MAPTPAAHLGIAVISALDVVGVLGVLVEIEHGCLVKHANFFVTPADNRAHGCKGVLCVVPAIADAARG